MCIRDRHTCIRTSLMGCATTPETRALITRAPPSANGLSTKGCAGDSPRTYSGFAWYRATNVHSKAR
eukprot:7690466-Alexandrium_andersonii.AAC.1